MYPAASDVTWTARGKPPQELHRLNEVGRLMVWYAQLWLPHDPSFGSMYSRFSYWVSPDTGENALPFVPAMKMFVLFWAR